MPFQLQQANIYQSIIKLVTFQCQQHQCINLQILIQIIIISQQQQQMFGGKLVPHSCHFLTANCESKNDIMLIGFGTCFYLFDKTTEKILSQINMGHQYQIICSYWSENNNQLVTLDRNGVIKACYIRYQTNNKQQWKVLCSLRILQRQSVKHSNKKKAAGKQTLIKQAKICNTIEKQFTIYYVLAGQLHRCEINLANSSQKKISIDFISSSQITHGKHINKIFTTEDSQSKYIACVSGQNHKNIWVMSGQEDGMKHWQYSHKEQITSVAISQQEKSLILGDSKGKIYVLNGFFNSKKYITTKLQWHTNPVSSLFLNDQYLYSAGEEGVVVMWHIRDLSRDFLPRIGSAINQIECVLKTNQIVCYLRNNEVKIIDLSHDKQVYCFNVLHNPKGYITQSLKENNIWKLNKIQYNHKLNISALDSIAGRLQFLNLEQANCSQLQIQNRNLVSSLDSSFPQPHEIVSFCFCDEQWNNLAVAMQGQHNYSCLKFYRKEISKDNGYELISKVQNPHQGQIKQCIGLKNDQYLTYSTQDTKIRTWSQIRQNKKSIIKADIIYWKCTAEFSYRDMFPISVSVFSGNVAIAYKKQILIFEENIKRADLINEEQPKSIIINKTDSQIKQIELLSKEMISVIYTDNTLEICHFGQKLKPLAVKTRIQGQSVQKIGLYSSNNKTAVVLNFYHEKNVFHILILNCSSGQFQKSYQCDVSNEEEIISCFWIKNNNFLILTNDLIFRSLTGEEFIKYGRLESYKSELEMEEESTQVRQINFKQDLWTLNDKWVARQQILKDKNKNIFENIHLLPNCSTALNSLLDDFIL